MTSLPQVLILDDEPAVRDALQLILKHEGMQIQCAETSDQALELARHHRFDLILSDISHPGVNGLDLLAVWKQSHPTIPVVLVSARLDEETTPRALQLGAAACCAKPFNVEQLRAAIQAGLAAHHPASSFPNNT